MNIVIKLEYCSLKRCNITGSKEESGHESHQINSDKSVSVGKCTIKMCDFPLAITSPHLCSRCAFKEEMSASEISQRGE